MDSKTIEQNKLIAEFMDIPKCDRCEEYCGRYKFGTGIYFEPSEMEYHALWNWLMPVLAKINAYQNDTWQRDIIVNGTIATLITLDIEKCYSAVINFINWYNKQ